MNVLKDKQTVNYSYISRYATFPIYYHTIDKKYVYGITNQLKESITYVEYKIVQGDTLDSLAEEYYGRPDYYWVIADFNRIQDPFIDLFNTYESIRIPNLSTISFKKD